MSARLRTEFVTQCVRARAISIERTRHRLVLVVFALDRRMPDAARIVIQGGTIVDCVWERGRQRGGRFRALRAYMQGREIPVPTHLKGGY